MQPSCPFEEKNQDVQEYFHGICIATLSTYTTRLLILTN